MKKAKFNLFNKGVLAAAMLSVATLMSCQKDNSLAPDLSQGIQSGSQRNGEAIPGQYIVILKNDNSGSTNMGLKDIKSDVNSMLTDLNIGSVQMPGSSFNSISRGFVANLNGEQLAK